MSALLCVSVHTNKHTFFNQIVFVQCDCVRDCEPLKCLECERMKERERESETAKSNKLKMDDTLTNKSCK